MRTVRVACHRATGDRYIVQQIDMRTQRVHCWGEVRSYKGLAMKHGPSVSFARADVDVEECAYTQQLVRNLFAQAERIIDLLHGPVQRVRSIIANEADRAYVVGLINAIPTLPVAPAVRWCPKCDLCCRAIAVCPTCGTATQRV